MSKRTTIAAIMLTGLLAVVMSGTLGCGAAAAGEAPSPGQILWYAQPAQNWEKQALPIGNGRLGAMIFGGMNKEHIQFNEESLWIGDEKETGAHQAFGDLFVAFDHSNGTSYRRQLDLERAIHTVTYTSGGVQYRREYFASHPAQAMVFRFTADQPGAYSGCLELTDAHQAKIVAQGNRLTAAGSLTGYSPQSLVGGWANSAPVEFRHKTYDICLDYESQALVLHEGGSVEVKDGKLFFRQADSLTVLLAAGTDFVQDRSKGWRGTHPHAAITGRLDKAAAMSYSALLAEHIRDYQSLFGRLNLDLGTSSGAIRQLPTDLRLKAYQAADPYSKAPAVSVDPEFESLVFQYGRYLMISCSRQGDLPATLQGVWNNSNYPFCRGDYHSDVNIQMNYWFVDQANLPGCFEPLSEWLWSVIPVKREATRKEYKIRGFACRSENGLFGGASYYFVPGDAAWIAQNIWDHYAFTQDKNYLATRAYPILKELCEFWEDYLKERPDGKLVSRASVSPEHGPKAEGNAYEQQLAYDLFSNTIEAAKILGQDDDFRKKVESMRSRLLGPQVGSWGQVMEWSTEINRPVFSVNAKFEKEVKMVVLALRQKAQNDPQSSAAYVWGRLGDALRQKLNANPKDTAALVEGLNALVSGEALSNVPAFAKEKTDKIALLCGQKDPKPELTRWVNWYLVVCALGMEKLVMREDSPLDWHRHTSHLIAVYPGRQITPAATPEWAKAACVSLAARGETGDSRREWAWVLRSALWARLAEAEKAYHCLNGLFAFNVMPNLLQTHPPFQIDGNFGFAAAVGEMLIQSHEQDADGLRMIRLLPALPKAWPSGSVKGICARGGFTVDMSWNDGKLTGYRITSAEPKKLRVQVGAENTVIVSEAAIKQ